jgi:putative transposase
MSSRHYNACFCGWPEESRCQQRGPNQLARSDVAGPLLESVLYRNEKFIWFAHLFMLMPDHVHGLLTFPPSPHTVRNAISLWKRWTARQLRIEWERDFFEHRLRSDESWREKADYILANPVRKGLVKEAKDWPWVFVPKPG